LRPVVLGPGEGETMTVFGNELTIKAGGAYCLVDYSAGPGSFALVPPDFARIGEIASRYDVETVGAD
jgi:hypothetical protein